MGFEKLPFPFRAVDEKRSVVQVLELQKNGLAAFTTAPNLSVTGPSEVYCRKCSASLPSILSVDETPVLQLRGLPRDSSRLPQPPTEYNQQKQGKLRDTCPWKTCGVGE